MKSMKFFKLPKRSLFMVKLSVLSFFLAGISYAAGADPSLGDLSSNVVSSLANMARLITAGAYVGGFGFAVGAILKFKAHKDNPTQIPVGTPIALLFIAAALIFLPAIFGVSSKTIFNSAASVGGVTGVTNF